MANTSSAKKAGRAAIRRRVFNMRRKKAMKDAGKDMSKALAARKSAEAAVMLPALYQAIDKAAKRGVIHGNTAARMKSRAARQLKALAA